MIDGPGFVILSNQKPALGEPCNGCGMCCQNEACILSRTLLESTAAPCIALEWDGHLYRCGLMLHPSRYLGTPSNIDAILASSFKKMAGPGDCDSG